MTSKSINFLPEHILVAQIRTALVVPTQSFPPFAAAGELHDLVRD